MKQNNNKGKRGWKMGKSKELEKIDNWEEAKEELGNSTLADREDCRDQNHN
jgi:hypothetical protein